LRLFEYGKQLEIARKSQRLRIGASASIDADFGRLRDVKNSLCYGVKRRSAASRG
jgi:hypothetical protein